MSKPAFIWLVGLLFLLLGVDAQQLQGDCLRLLGSVVCPAYQYAYINPSNLSLAYPFFADVNSVASFDSAALSYFSNPFQYTNTKFGTSELGCSNASDATIRWEKTVLCSQWVNEQWSLGCTALYTTSMKMVCQQTCLQFSASENSIVNSTEYCPGTDLTGGTRETTLNKDFVDCTNWTTYSTNNTETCIRGEDNESNCGYGTSISQLCGFCNNDSPDDCCYSGSTDMSVCGFTLPVRVNGTSTSIPSNTVTGPSQSITSTNTATNTVSPNGTSANDTAGTTSKLRGGRLAGVIVGSVLGGILLLLLLLFLLLCLRRKRNNQKNQRDSVSSFAASQARPNSTANGNSGGIFGLFSPKQNDNSQNGQPRNTSEKGLLSRNSNSLSQSNIMNNSSTPTMGGDTFYSPSTHTGNGNNFKSSEGLPLSTTAIASGAGGLAGLGGLGGPGNRNSIGTILPRVKDENQIGEIWIEPGMEVSVLWPYTATLPDELDLRPGMKLRVVRLFDDAWGTAEVISTNSDEGSKIGKQGAFPIVCVSEGSSLGSSNSHSSNSSH
uniref:SH3 domain-containing protein n=1 Tax=Kwoniella pini CBS 10737 TaxID=1296096 RepID=A0A1B9HT96_9TREE|nr:uncharacterized protein I206_07344 [Kwoniella pini CBS 10737]OCF46491.1 hypothetical protein I206_07344 [Kwoniella pini CBS 10737]